MIIHSKSLFFTPPAYICFSTRAAVPLHLMKEKKYNKCTIGSGTSAVEKMHTAGRTSMWWNNGMGKWHCKQAFVTTVAALLSASASWIQYDNIAINDLESSGFNIADVSLICRSSNTETWDWRWRGPMCTDVAATGRTLGKRGKGNHQLAHVQDRMHHYSKCPRHRN